MKFYRGLLLTIISLIFVTSIFWDVYLYTLTAQDTYFNFLYNLIYGSIFIFGGLTVLFYAIKFSVTTNLGKMLVFFGSGLLSFACGNIVWYLYNNLFKIEVPFPSLADIFYIAFYPFMIVGTIYLLRIYKTLLNKSIIRDSIIIVIISFIVIFTIFFRIDFLSSGTSLFQRLVTILYPFGDAVIISITLVALRVGGGRLHPSLYILTFGLLMQSVADLLFNYRNIVGLYWNGDIADLFFSFGGFFMSIGIFEIINNLSQTFQNPKNPPTPQQIT